VTEAARPPLHLAVALEGAGWHPRAWREPGARPGDLLTAGYWASLVAEAEEGLLDFVTFEDSFGLAESQGRHPAGPGRPAGRLDAVLIAARVAPLTRHVGLVPAVIVTHTEPFHISKAIATLDYVSQGRAGLRVRISARPEEAALFGRRADLPGPGADGPARERAVTPLFDEAADFVEVVRRLWDSWDDDAEIRDVATGRFVDRDRLHYIDFEGRWFRVRGPSITPRPPQGQPLVTALAHRSDPYRLVARSADLGFVTPHDAAEAASIIAEIRALEADERAAAETGPGGAGGTGWPPGGPGAAVLADLVVFLDAAAGAAASRAARLDDLAGQPFRSDAEIFAGTPAQLADLLLDWQAAGLAGFRLRPATLPHDLVQITRGLVPELQRRDAFRRGYEAATLRGLLGLSRPASRYAA
jgi:alkanesulfonate monooxygenase SsuD/methylene tetrahydromethanopterin reductase-like flavin-dependent oxidoreductase (luciferase family)